MILIPKIGHEKDYTSQRFNSFVQVTTIKLDIMFEHEV